MFSKQFTAKSKLITEVSILILLLLNEISRIYFTRYSHYFSSAWWILTIILVFCTYKFIDINDELYDTILSKVNKKSITLMYLSIGFISAIATSRSYIFTSVTTVGLLITSLLLIISIYRLFLFIYYEKKGF